MVAASESLEWGTPVLFSRSDDNRLIELPSGDARLIIETKPLEPETILIPTGPFLMGTDDPGASAWETPQHMVNLPAYRIGRYPVTNQQYAKFIRDQKVQDVPKDAGWFLREPPASRLDHPVTGVSWGDAIAYCQWLSGETGRLYHLPSEAEWEKAASWAEGQESRGAGINGVQRIYPWGNEWTTGRCNAGTADTMPVTANPAGASAYGCEDMLGNAQEWTATLWGTQPGQPQQGYRDRLDGGPSIVDPAHLPTQARMVHRGGSYKLQPGDLRCSIRGNAAPDSRVPWRGFRVVMAIVTQA